MADVDGVLQDRGEFGAEVPSPRPLSLLTMTSGLPDYPRTYYKMRGYNTVLTQDEVWVVADAPNTTPPIGPCIDIEIAAVWDV